MNWYHTKKHQKYKDTKKRLSRKLFDENELFVRFYNITNF